MAHLRRMSLLNDESPLGDVSKKMDMFVKKRYVDKVKLEHMDDSGEKAEMELRWGARARIEMPEENVVQFMKEVKSRGITQWRKFPGLLILPDCLKVSYFGSDFPLLFCSLHATRCLAKRRPWV